MSDKYSRDAERCQGRSILQSSDPIISRINSFRSTTLFWSHSMDGLRSSQTLVPDFMFVCLSPMARSDWLRGRRTTVVQCVVISSFRYKRAGNRLESSQFSATRLREQTRREDERLEARNNHLLIRKRLCSSRLSLEVWVPDWLISTRRLSRLM